VVKANAYGHGLFETVNALTDADGFALVEMDKAIALRKQGLKTAILVLEGFFDQQDCIDAIDYQLTPAICQFWQIEVLKACLNGRSIPVYIKYNTGMNRMGFTDEQIVKAIEEITNLGCPITIMSHFANADNPIGIEVPFVKIGAYAAEYRVCLANSAAIFNYPETHGDWIRPGISLYGGSPFHTLSSEEIGLKPVMTLSADIIGIQSIHPGDAVGYGSTFVADKPMKIAIVACGYGDGYPRNMPTGSPVLVDNQPSQTVGRVSMDMLCVDLTHLPDATIGSTVTLWGKGLSADRVAKCLNTISYELFCHVTARVPFIYQSS
jgi:alanine racemase